MLFRKNSDKENNELQYQFTAYLVTAVRRRRQEIVQAQIRRNEREVSMDGLEHFCGAAVQNPALDGMADLHVKSFEDVYFENEDLERALQKLSERDRYVLFAKVVAGHSFDELAEELGIGYKGVAAVYYRAIRKLKKELEDET